MYSFLNKVTVLDFCRLMPSLATQQLADLGANVIKIEQPPAGDYLRDIPPKFGGVAEMHLALNRNKRSLALNLRSPEARPILERLLGRARVVVTSSRIEANRRMGLDYESLKDLRKDLVYCLITNYGEGGPFSPLPAHGLSIDMAAGLIPVDHAGGRPTIPINRFSIGSRIAGLNAAIGILAALLDGNSHSLEVSCWHSAMAFNFANVTGLANRGELAPALGSLGPRYDIYETSDTRLIFFAAAEKKFWENFCRLVDRADLIEQGNWESGHDYGQNEPGHYETIAKIMRGRTQQEWLDACVRADVPVSPVLSMQEALESQQAAQGLMTRYLHPGLGEVSLPAPPITESSQKHEVHRAAPTLGQHTDEVLKEIGFDKDAVRELRQRQVVG